MARERGETRPNTKCTLQALAAEGQRATTKAVLSESIVGAPLPSGYSGAMKITRTTIRPLSNVMSRMVSMLKDEHGLDYVKQSAAPSASTPDAGGAAPTILLLQ